MTQEEANAEIAKFSGVIEGIEFASGSSTIRKRSRAPLDEAVEALKNFPNVELEIVGHTDSSGKASANEKLSEARAKSVKKYLVKQGVDDERITTRGAGESEPIDTNETKAGRAKNRRIEFKIVD
jgi:outer membrane protein OmpA-like peptidoglycan-associated protein